MTFFDELKRRNVLRVAAAYVVMAWLIIQVAETILPQYSLAHHVRTVITMLAIGFIPAIILAWALEWTPEGIKLDSGVTVAGNRDAAIRAGRKFDRIVIVILTVALAWFVYDKVVPQAPDVRHSIAVLPFSNESPDAMPDYLADGLAGEVRDLLAKLPGLLVIERSSAASFTTQDVAMVEIAARLGVSRILTGAVGQVGSRIEVSTSLHDASSGAPLWSQSYTGSLSDIFSIQDDVARDVAMQLDLQADRPLPKSRRTTPEAFALTLQARQIWHDKLMMADADTMAALLDEALEIDPNYTPAMVLKIYANFVARTQGLISSDEENERWLKLAGRILAIEPDNASVHNMFAWEALYVDRDLQAAASSYARALDNGRNDAEILRHVARFVLLIGRESDALAIIDRSMAVDPLCSICLYEASKIYMYTGQLEKAETLRQRFVTMYDQGYSEYGLIKLLQGKVEEALAIFHDIDARMAQRDAPDDGRAQVGLAMAFHDLGRHEESDQQLAIFIDKFGEENPREVAKIHAWRNEKDEAFEWFHRAERQGRDHEGMLMANPVYRNLHSDPRWAAVRESRGLSEEQLARLEFPVELLTQFRGR